MARIIPIPRPKAASGPTSSTAREDAALPGDDRALLIAGALFWLASVARVISALVQREVFGAESSLAFLCVLLLPWLCWRSRANRPSGTKAEGSSPSDSQSRDGVILPFVKAAPETVSGRDHS